MLLSKILQKYEMPLSHKYALDMPSPLPTEGGFTKRRCSAGLVRGRQECHYQRSVSFIIVLGGGVIIIVIADRAVRGRSKQVY